MREYLSHPFLRVVDVLTCPECGHHIITVTIVFLRAQGAVDGFSSRAPKAPHLTSSPKALQNCTSWAPLQTDRVYSARCVVIHRNPHVTGTRRLAYR